MVEVVKVTLPKMTSETVLKLDGSEIPIALLATELLEQIFENLEFVHLLNVQLVCKRWAEVHMMVNCFLRV